ncbi:MAG: hypothetical protein IT256_07770 [Chitinophagaceae bacterium]|nr:hypothetical protein [Chitinophagaceae bacterium]
MKKGNIHPRDISVLYDNTLRFRPNNSKIMKCDLNLSGYYQTNIFALNSYSKPPNYLAINKMRSDLYIVPLEVDEAKQKFCKDKNIKVWEFGFFGCR